MNTDQKFKLLSLMGYKGPKDEGMMSSFISSNPAAEAKFGQFQTAAQGMNKGGMVGFSEGGLSIREFSRNGTTWWSAVDSSGQPRHGPWYSKDQADSWLSSYNQGQTTHQQANNTSQQTTTSTNTSSQSNFDQYRGDLNSIYQELLGRDVQDAGLGFYGNLLNQGTISLDQVRADVEGSPERQQYLSSQQTQPPVSTPDPTQPTSSPAGSYTQAEADAEINRLYQTYLNRAPDQAGMEFYRNLLMNGSLSLGAIEEDIKNNSSNTANPQPDTPGTGTDHSAFINSEINQFYNQFANRNADPAGLAFWIEKINSGEMTLDEVRQYLETSLGGDGGATFDPTTRTEAENLQLLTQGFRDILGRNADQAGLDFYMSKINAGEMSVEEALNDIITSQEAQLISNQRYSEAQALRNNQRQFITNAYSDPAALAYAQEVAQIDATPGTMLDPSTGQVSGDTGYDPSTIDPTQPGMTVGDPNAIDTATYQADQINQELQDTLGDLEAQTALPSDKATVRGQLEILMDDFQDGAPPWAQGAMREATAIMQARGMGASSMAGQAITQAALEAATVIAQQDANTFATFELRNLDNRQQTAIFKAQQRIAGLFTDQAANNAAMQFNASSQNQTNQFMASLEQRAAEFNASQVAAIAEVNINAENASKQFNSQMKDMRERFNAQNSLIIAQANAQWRQNINTLNTAAQNEANRDYAQTVNAISTASLEQLWQRERDLMTFAFTASESGLDRELELLFADKQEELVRWQQQQEEDAAKGYIFTRLASNVLFGSDGGGGLLGGIF